MITDDYMKKMIASTKSYSIVILKTGPNRNMSEVEQIIWEHARRNFSLRVDGVLSIVCPIADGSDTSGIGIFNTDVEEVKSIMDKDPAVEKGIFIYEIHPCRSFPGDSLPK